MPFSESDQIQTNRTRNENHVPTVLKLTDDTNIAVVKNYICGYRAQHEKPENEGAPWWATFEECVAFARKKGWPVDQWLIRLRKAKPRCPTCGRVGHVQGITLDGNFDRRPQTYKCHEGHEWEVENKP